jgi:hypothetical protein
MPPRHRILLPLREMSPAGQLLFALVAMCLGVVPLAESLTAVRWLRRIAQVSPRDRGTLVRRALQVLRLSQGDPVPPPLDADERAIAAIRLSVWRRATWGSALVALGLLLALDAVR